MIQKRASRDFLLTYPSLQWLVSLRHVVTEEDWKLFCICPSGLSSTLITAMKQKRSDFHKKLEIIYLCEVGRLPKSKTGRQYGSTSAIFTTLKNTEKIWPAVL
jgi:hypothetical protein